MEILLFIISCLVLAAASTDQSRLTDWIRVADGIIACIQCPSLISIGLKLHLDLQTKHGFQYVSSIPGLKSILAPSVVIYRTNGV
jgi:hypothetical protein